MNWIIKNIKNIGLLTLLSALIVTITWIVNMNRDIADAKALIEKLQREKFDEAKTIFLIRLETSDIKMDVRDIKNYLINHH